MIAGDGERGASISFASLDVCAVGRCNVVYIILRYLDCCNAVSACFVSPEKDGYLIIFGIEYRGSRIFWGILNN